MLESIHLRNVGPAPEMRMDLGPRLNLITGDNGLGKSFLLDVAWWALTRTWAREMVVPKPGAKAEIAYEYTKKTKPSYAYTSKYEPARVRWTVKQSRPPIPGLILYAQVDGGFSVWDPMRNYWTEDAADRPNAFLFSPEQVWKGNEHCKGVLNDWLLWQVGRDRKFNLLTQVLNALSPSPAEPLLPGEPREITIKDSGPTPTLRMPYGEDVPLLHASAGMRRIIALSYLLTWVWERHEEAAKLRDETPAGEIIFLIDEIEGHLHPQWQRRIVPALLKVMDALTGKHGSRVQLIAATHSPLVLASVEPEFNPALDELFLLHQEEQRVILDSLVWAKQGDATNWLVSDVFGLEQARSVLAERAIEAAEALMRGDTSALPPGLKTKKAIHAELTKVLPGHDPFWPRWLVEAKALDLIGRHKA